MKLEEVTEFINTVKYRTALNSAGDSWTSIIINWSLKILIKVVI